LLRGVRSCKEKENFHREILGHTRARLNVCFMNEKGEIRKIKKAGIAKKKKENGTYCYSLKKSQHLSEVFRKTPTIY